MYNMSASHFNCDDEYPLLNSKIDYDSYFREQISYLYFNLTKKNDISVVLMIGNQFRQVLDLLKKRRQEDHKFGIDYLELVYRMVAQTRDIFGGKGEHDLSYCLLMNLYEAFPTLSIFLLHRFVQPISNVGDCIGEITYGSWRDMKYFCDFLRKHSRQNENHPLIDVCIELINTQLAKDLHSWKFSINAFSKEHISYVSKWIPRENKKFNWLFLKLAIHWANTHKSYLLPKISEYESYVKALNKAKKMYRKTISLLNKGLDTTEIKQCSQQLHNIIPSHVPSYATMKQSNLVFATSLLTKRNLFDRIKCGCLFEKHFETIFDKHNNATGTYDKSPLYYTLTHFVKEAIRLKNKNHNNNNNEMYVLNKQWECFSKSNEFHKFENIIPMLDVSFDIQMNTDAFYSAIGIALVIAQNSNYGKRILTMDNLPAWIILEPSSNFICDIENIMKSIKSNGNTAFNVKKAFDILSIGFTQTNSSYKYIENMKLLFISFFADKNQPIAVYNHFKNSFKNNKIYPSILFWNLNTDTLLDIPTDIPCISGSSNSILRHVQNNITPQYNFVLNILNNSRYDILSNYIRNLMKDY